MPMRRSIKNVVNNYTDTQVKVREATSNDPWGPSSSLMSEIADMTYNVMAFSEIMTMIWKRLNDHGKNWRHVYKSLVLLEYIIKTGTERVAQQCRENVFAIQTLKDFQFVDKDGKDQGVNVREKSKQLVALLKDEERLKTERTRALKTKERFVQASSVAGVGKTTNITAAAAGNSSPTNTSPPAAFPSTESPAGGNTSARGGAGGASPLQTVVEMEQARPSTAGEEELQLQLALAMSREEAEEAQRQARSDDVRLQLALNESLEATSKPHTDSPLAVPAPPSSTAGGGAKTLLDLSTPSATSKPPSDPWGSPSQIQPAPADPWGSPAPPVPALPTANSGGPWPKQPSQPQAASDPWGGPAVAPNTNTNTQPGWGEAQPPARDPWAPQSPQPIQQTSPWETNNGVGGGGVDDLLSGMVALNSQPLQPLDPQGSGDPSSKTPESFLGENSSLVNLDTLVGPTPVQQERSRATNPFELLAPAPAPLQDSNPLNPFQQQARPPAPTLNQMRSQPQLPPMMSSGGVNQGPAHSLPQPLMPMQPTTTNAPQTNPFLL